MTMSDPVPFSPGSTFEPASAAEALGEGRDFSPARSLGHLALEPSSPSSHVYHRYHIEIQTTPDIVPLPPRVRVKVKKHRLIALVLSLHTVHAHLRAIYSKLGVTSRSAATRYAFEHHLA